MRDAEFGLAGNLANAARDAGPGPAQRVMLAGWPTARYPASCSGTAIAISVSPRWASVMTD